MNRLDRALGILLLLSGKSFSAAELSRRFEVSTRTIYRDVDTLCALGAPIYAEMGRNGGFQLVEGYFLPPVMFSEGEAVSLLLGLALLGRLRARPFAAELEISEQKLLAAMPNHLRAALAKTRQIIGFEHMPADIFHPERSDPAQPVAQADDSREGAVVSAFARAIFDRRGVAIDYRSPYSGSDSRLQVTPLGLLWDRDLWYLVGVPAGRTGEPRLWRADRVLAITPGAPADPPAFDIGALLGHRWLRSAIRSWSEMSPVLIRLTRAQADRLQRDWYYRHARFEALPGGQALMTFGEDDRAVVLELLRWLGPGAKLIAPAQWIPAIRAELAAMLAAYDDDRVIG